MNRFQKRIIGITSALASLTFAMITAAVGTVAWFVASARQQASGMSVEAGSPEISIDYKVFRYDFNKKEGRGWANTASQFYLPDYEVFLKDPSDDFFNNAHTNAILMATVDLGNLDTSSKELNFNVTCSNSSSYETNSKVNPYTSNIAQFKCFLSSYLEVDETFETNIYGIDITDTDKNIYDAATEIFNQIETPTTFVSVNGTAYNKTQNTLTITPYLPQGIHIQKITFFVECSYNERLVDHYLSTHSAESTGSYFDISGDMEKIVVTTSDNTKGTSNSGKYIKLKSQYNVIDSNYLLLHRDALTGDGSNEGVILDGALNNEDLTKGNNTQNVDIVNNTVTTNPDVNAASFKYTIDDSSSADYKKLESSKFRHSLSSYTYDDANRLPIGNKNQTTAQILRSSSGGYTNDISIRNDGYADVTSITGDENPDTHLWFNNASNVQGFKYYKESQDRGNTIQDIEVFRYAENAAAVGELVRIEIQGSPKTQYYTTTPFDRSGFRVIAYYSDGGRFDVTDLVTYSIGNGAAVGDSAITAYIASHGDSNQTIVCSYEEYDGNIQTASYNIHITTAGISSITIYQNPSTTTYYEGQTMNYTGLIISINYNDGRSPEHVSYGDSRILYKTYAQGATLSYTGSQHTVVVGIGAFETSFKITVNMKSVTVSASEVRVRLRETITITASTTPSGQTLDWGVSDPNIATIKSFTNTQCVIEGQSVGNITVTATIRGTSRHDEIEIEVFDVDVYKKVTSEQADWTGRYLLVYETSSSGGYIWNGNDQNNSGISTQISNGEIEGKPENAVELYLAKYGDGYSAKIVGENSTHNNEYIYGGTSNCLNYSSSQYELDISYNNEYDCPEIYYSSSMMQYNTSASRFRFYTSTQEDIALYKIPSDKTEVGFDKTTATVAKGEQFQLKVSIISGKDGYGLNDISWTRPSDATFNSSTGVLTWTPGSSATSTNIVATLPNGKSATCTITVASLHSLTISNPITSLNKGSTFNFGGTATAHYTTNGSTIDSSLNRDVTSNVSFSGYNMSVAGSYNVVVSYTQGGITKTASYTLTVTSATNLSKCQFNRSYFSKGVQNYTSTWTCNDTSTGGISMGVQNFNNNNSGWDFIRCGNKNDASVAKVYTSNSLSFGVTKVTITIDSLTASKINSITLYSGSSVGSPTTSLGTFTKATGDQVITLSTATNAGLYFTIVFDCAKGSSNGLLQLSFVKFE